MVLSNQEWVLPEYENNLAEFRHSLNLNIKELAEILGVHHAVYRCVELGQTSIYQRKGTIKPWIMRLCDKFHCNLEDLFPREMCGLPSTYDHEDFVELYDNHWSTHPYMDELEYLELRLDMEKIINGKLTREYKSRYREVIRMYFFENMTLKEIGEQYQVQREVIRQNIDKALRIMRGDRVKIGAYTDEYLRKRTVEKNVPALGPGAAQLRHTSAETFAAGESLFGTGIKEYLIDYDEFFNLDKSF